MKINIGFPVAILYYSMQFHEFFQKHNFVKFFNNLTVNNKMCTQPVLFLSEAFRRGENGPGRYE